MLDMATREPCRKAFRCESRQADRRAHHCVHAGPGWGEPDGDVVARVPMQVRGQVFLVPLGKIQCAVCLGLHTLSVVEGDVLSLARGVGSLDCGRFVGFAYRFYPVGVPLVKVDGEDGGLALWNVCGEVFF